MKQTTPQFDLQAFVDRLRSVFPGKNNKDIGGILGVGPSRMTEIMNARKPPTIEQLITISLKTKRSIHWLVTGDGEEVFDPLRFLGEAERRIVGELSEGRDVAVADVIGSLVGEGMAARASKLLARYAELDEGEKGELRLLVSLTEEPERITPPPRRGGEAGGAQKAPRLKG